MRRPQEYVDLLNSFVSKDSKAVRFEEGVNREDWICLRMAAYCLKLPVDVRYYGKEKTLILIKEAEI